VSAGVETGAGEPDRHDGGPPTGGPVRSRRMLVVEDDTGLCDAIGRLARGSGAEVWQAHTLDDGLRLLERSPDLVIADLRLAGRSSFPLIEAAVRRRPAPAVVAMSGQASAEESFRLGQLGVRAYLAKPFASDALIAAIERAEGEVPDGAARADRAEGSGAASFDSRSAPAVALGFGTRLLRALRRAAARRLGRGATGSRRRGPRADGS
jgi:DNA-binding NtrC family response regulator